MGYLISKWIRGPILICMYSIVYKIFGSLLDLRSLLLICTGVCMPIDIVPNTKWVYTCVFCVCLWLSIYLLFIKNSFVKFFSSYPTMFEVQLFMHENEFMFLLFLKSYCRPSLTTFLSKQDGSLCFPLLWVISYTQCAWLDHVVVTILLLIHIFSTKFKYWITHGTTYYLV
jgi:hypothetical protein